MSGPAAQGRRAFAGRLMGRGMPGPYGHISNLWYTSPSSVFHVNTPSFSVIYPWALFSLGMEVEPGLR